MKKLLLTLVCAVAAMSAAAQWGPRSRVVTDTIHSDVLGVDRAYTVYLPKSFDVDSTRTYPVLYLLHGLYGDNNGWFRDQRANGVLDRYFNIPGWAYEDFFFNELVPRLEKRYRAGGSRGRRAVAGLSMGGGGTTSYAQRHPDKFCAAYAMSALMDIPEVGAVPSKSPDDKIALLTRSVQQNSCTRYVAEADDARREALRTVRWYVDCGDDDFLLDRNIEFVQAMHAAGVPVEFRVRDGGHDSEYWHTALYTCLPFVSRAFDR